MPVEQRKVSAKGKAVKNALASPSVNNSSVTEIPGGHDVGREGRHAEAEESKSDMRQNIAVAGQQRMSWSEGLMKTLTKATESTITLAFLKKDLQNEKDASQKPTGHVYGSILLSESDILAGDIGESKCRTERSQQHTYGRIEGKENRATLGNVYDANLMEKFYGKEKPKDETKCFGRCTKEGSNGDH